MGVRFQITHSRRREFEELKDWSDLYNALSDALQGWQLEKCRGLRTSDL